MVAFNCINAAAAALVASGNNLLVLGSLPLATLNAGTKECVTFQISAEQSQILPDVLFRLSLPVRLYLPGVSAVQFFTSVIPGSWSLIHPPQ